MKDNNEKINKDVLSDNLNNKKESTNKSNEWWEELGIENGDISRKD